MFGSRHIIATTSRLTFSAHSLGLADAGDVPTQAPNDGVNDVRC